MKRAVAAPLLSILLPGLGQLVNRQAGKGAALVAVSGLVALVGVGLTMFKLNQAMVRIMDLPPNEQTLDALSKAMWQEGVGLWRCWAACSWPCWCFPFGMPTRVGKRLDSADQVKEVRYAVFGVR
jgi:TM2 domain-containing membrane protein YozV